MTFSIFADESGINPSCRCYSIGALVLKDDYLDQFNDNFHALQKKHRIDGEIKWKKLQKNHGIINFGIDLIYGVIDNAKYSVIIVNKEMYDWWGKDKERGFYVTYHKLLKNIMKYARGNYRVFIDNRSDKYKKQDEVLQKITNYTLESGEISEINKSDSRLHPAIQTVDLLTGAINASHNSYLKKIEISNRGKRIFINKFAEILGWDALYYDTFPKEEFNIWQFPTEYRGVPGSKEIKVTRSVSYVKKEELIDEL